MNALLVPWIYLSPEGIQRVCSVDLGSNLMRFEGEDVQNTKLDAVTPLQTEIMISIPFLKPVQSVQSAARIVVSVPPGSVARPLSELKRPYSDKSFF